MRPTTEELLRGLQGSLLTYVLPELQTNHGRTELMLTYALLGIAANEVDGAAQRLVDDNVAMRAIAREAADTLTPIDAALAAELRALANETDASVLVSELSSTNTRLRGVIGRAGVLLEERNEPSLHDLRAAIITHLRAEAQQRNHEVLGPRSDG
ncbi:MAG: hypothetical protein WEB04_11650 [Dehalococcoidia bacterium]